MKKKIIQLNKKYKVSNGSKKAWFKKGHKINVGRKFGPLSENTKEKLRIANLGKKHALGYKHTPEQRKAKSESQMGKFTEEKNGAWKGDEAGYMAMHLWIVKWKGKPRKCENCGTITAKKYEWANIDHSYKRVLEDYIRMCTSCHRKYDIKHNNYGRKLK